MVVILSSEIQFESILQSNPLVVVDFTATWCGPCKVVAPKFEALGEKYKDVVFVKIDIDQFQKITNDCGIKSMPTFIIYKSAKKVSQVVGANIVKVEQELLKNF